MGSIVEKANRIVISNIHLKGYPSNGISNTKYNILTFLPKVLYKQFGNFMNIYFIIIGVIQLFQIFSTVNWVYLFNSF
jgi:hypothetical protein